MIQMVNAIQQHVARRAEGVTAGRTRFLKGTRDIVIQAVKDGEYAASAAAKARIHANTLRAWVDRGERAALALEDGEELDAVEREYADFFYDLMHADGTAEGEAVGEVRTAGRNGNWIASMTYLERRHGQRWKRREVTEHTGPGGGPIKHEIDNSTNQLAEVLTALAEAGVLPKGIDLKLTD